MTFFNIVNSAENLLTEQLVKVGLTGLWLQDPVLHQQLQYGSEPELDAYQTIHTKQDEFVYSTSEHV